MIIRPGKGDSDPKERALWGDLISLGMVFPIAIVLGYFIGKWVGGKLGHPEAGSLIGLFWGVATGFYELYKVTQRMNQKGGPGPRDGQGGGDDGGA